MGDAGAGLNGFHAVVVEDDTSQRHIFDRWLRLAGYRVSAFEDAESCLAEIDSVLADVVCLDLNLPGMDGIEALRQLRRRYPSVPVVVLTGDAEVDTVVECMRLGAHDYLVKPLDRTRLVTQVRNAANHGVLELRVTQLEREAANRSYPGIVGTSEAMRGLYRQLDRVAPSPVTVLIHGESGSGKELVARAIHKHSAQASGPFVALNCAAIPESLQESELFGHEKGAFTGALERKIGRFEEADAGTLLLDEVAELSPSLQAKLLRVLQERSYRRLGGSRDLSSQFRLLAASHADLQERVRDGSFREDLFYRLAVFELEIPPLRRRLDDLSLLVEHFLADPRLVGERRGLLVTAEAMDLLGRYDWPGNVRELVNAVQRAAVVAPQDVIRPEDLPPRIRRSVEGDREPEARPHPARAREEEPARSAFTGGNAPARPSAPKTLEEIEREAVAAALERHKGNLSAVARELDIGRNTLYRKLDKHDLR